MKIDKPIRVEKPKIMDGAQKEQRPTFKLKPTQAPTTTAPKQTKSNPDKKK